MTDGQLDEGEGGNQEFDPTVLVIHWARAFQGKGLINGDPNTNKKHTKICKFVSTSPVVYQDQ